MNLPNQDLQNDTIEYTVFIDMMGVSENGVLSPISGSLNWYYDDWPMVEMDEPILGHRYISYRFRNRDYI